MTVDKVPKEGTTTRWVYDQLMAHKFVDLMDFTKAQRKGVIDRLRYDYQLDIRHEPQTLKYHLFTGDE